MIAKRNLLTCLFAFGIEMQVVMLVPILSIFFFSDDGFFVNLSNAGFWYGSLIAVSKIGGVASNIFITRLADKKSFYAAIMASLIGLCIFCLFAIAALGLNNIYLLGVGVLILSLLNATKAITISIVGDQHDSERVKLIGRVQGGISLGAIFGPIAAGYFVHTNNYLAFIFSFCAAIVLGVILIKYKNLFQRQDFKDGEEEITENFTKKILNTKTGYLSIFKNQEVLLVLVLLLINQLTWASYYEFIPVILTKHFDFEAYGVGIFMSSIAFFLLLTSLFFAQKFSKFSNSHRVLIFLFCLLYLGDLFAFLGVYSDFANILWLSSPVCAVSDMLIFMALMAKLSSLASAEQRSQIVGIALVQCAAIWAMTSFIGGILLDSVGIYGVFVFSLLSCFLFVININNFKKLFNGHLVRA